jgi:predicted dehydrogenase
MLTVDAAILGTGGWLGGTPGPAQGTQIGSWWTNKAKSGGQFHEQVTHTVDIARYLFGTAVSVSAFGATGFNCNIPGYATDDAAVVNIQFENGSIVNVLASVSSNAAGGVFLNVYARNVAFEFTGWEHSVKIRRKGEGEGGIIKGEDNIFSIEDRVFIDAVKSGDKSAIKSTYPDAAKTALVSSRWRTADVPLI